MKFNKQFFLGIMLLVLLLGVSSVSANDLNEDNSSYIGLDDSSMVIMEDSAQAGKSMLVAALCRIYKNRGYNVAPFKSQNMSLNSYTTKENGEIGIAQMLQAEAAMVEPSVHMNPILLKPKGDFTSNVIIQGKSIGDMNFYQYQHDYHNTAFEAIQESFNILKENC